MRNRSWTTGRLAATAVVTGVAAAVVAVGSPVAGDADAGPQVAAKPAPGVFALVSGVRHLTTSRGVKILFSFVASAENDNSGSTPETGPGTLDVTVASAGDRETHTWEFGLETGRLTLTSKRHVTLRTAAVQTSPYGRLRVTASPTGRAHTSDCANGGRFTTRRVNVHGTVAFTTRTKAWGRVSSGQHPFHVSHRATLVTYPNGYQLDSAVACPVPVQPACTSRTVGQTGVVKGNASTTFWAGNFAGRSHGYLQGVRVVQLNKTQGTRRIDQVTVPTPRQRDTFAHGTARLAVHAKGDRSSGSAVFRSTGVDEGGRDGCGTGNRKETDTLWNATYDNGRHHLRIREDIGGPFAVPNTKDAGIDRTES